MHNRKGQTLLEYTVILIVILGVMIAMKDYVKRGIQGRWKSSADELSDQYDPQHINSNIFFATQINSMSTVSVVTATYAGPNGPEMGQWTNRGDLSNTVEKKTEATQVGD